MYNEGEIKKEWNCAAESWVDFVRTGKDYYRDGLNNPATFKLIEDVKSLAVLDARARTPGAPCSHKTLDCSDANSKYMELIILGSGGSTTIPRPGARDLLLLTYP